MNHLWVCPKILFAVTLLQTASIALQPIVDIAKPGNKLKYKLLLTVPAHLCPVRGYLSTRWVVLTPTIAICMGYVRVIWMVCICPTGQISSLGNFSDFISAVSHFNSSLSSCFLPVLLSMSPSRFPCLLGYWQVGELAGDHTCVGSLRAALSSYDRTCSW